jgi:4-hydroxybenzoyl-CoA thioesterase
MSGNAAPQTFRSERPVRFSDCDPAGIVFFPRFLEMMNDLTEDWFGEGLEVPFDDLHLVHRRGVPLVHTHVEFLAACRMGERLALELRVEALGRSSIVLRVRGLVDGEERLRVRHKIAMVSTDGRLRAIPIPDGIRERMSRFLIPDAAPAADAPVSAGPPPARAFRSPQLVRFAHCDPAEIVFYPRFFDLFASVLEDWFAQGLGSPFGTDFMGPRNLRIPSLAITAQFQVACRLSEVIDFDLWVTRLGRSSLDLAIQGSVAGEPRLRAAWTMCVIDYATFKSTPIPDDLRERMRAFERA